MNNIIRIFFAWIILLGGVFAQTDNVITLEECVRTAIENNHIHKQALLNKEKADEQVDEAIGTSVMPKIDGTANYTNALQRGVFRIETPAFSGTFPMGSKHTLTAGISVEQPLFTGAMFLAVQIAETYAEVTKKAADYSEDDLILQVRQAYYTYLLAESFVKLADHQIKRAEENKKNTEIMYKAGLIAEYDYIRANVTYQNLIPEKTGAVNQQKQAMNNLKLVMGLQLDHALTVLDSLVYNEIQLPEYQDKVDSLIAKNNLIQQMELQTELQDLNASYEWTKHLPELQAFGNWQTQALEEQFTPFDWDYFNSMNVGLSLRIPIFKGFATNSRVQQAEIDFKISEENLINTKETIKNNFENVILQIKKSEEQVNAYKISVDQAERGYQIAIKRFNTGLGTQLEVTDALGALISSQVNYLQSVYDYQLNHARLDLITGKNLDEIEFN
ncbi:MAG: TolC family protein [Bacteroidota bacterium]